MENSYCFHCGTRVNDDENPHHCYDFQGIYNNIQPILISNTNSRRHIFIEHIDPIIIDSEEPENEIVINNVIIRQIESNEQTFNDIHTFTQPREETYKEKIKKIKLKCCDKVKTDSIECGVCMETKTKEVVVNFGCGHYLCVICLLSYLENMKSRNKIPNCHICRRDITEIKTFNNGLLHDLKYSIRLL
jgi:hypothetical protein